MNFGVKHQRSHLSGTESFRKRYYHSTLSRAKIKWKSYEQIIVRIGKA